MTLLSVISLLFTRFPAPRNVY